jgi:hypothetical protein
MSVEDATMIHALDINPIWSHFYDSRRRPAVTVCYLDDDGNGTAVGISICSDKDFPCKKVGRSISLQRARYALMHLADSAKEHDMHGLQMSSSVVERTNAIAALFGTDFRGGEGEKALKMQGVYKILYVNQPGFRFQRAGRQRKKSNSETPLPEAQKKVAKNTNSNSS